MDGPRAGDFLRASNQEEIDAGERLRVMSGASWVMHVVCTFEEAEAIMDAADRFFVGKCGCRENRGGCGRSHSEVCLTLNEAAEGSIPDKRPISREHAEAILREAREHRLVPRPFRDSAGRIEGICFCCDDCCSYFLNREEPCDKGCYTEETDLDACAGCGACVPACYFGARSMSDRTVKVDRDVCYGCGLCVMSCPGGAIRMVER